MARPFGEAVATTATIVDREELSHARHDPLDGLFQRRRFADFVAVAPTSIFTAATRERAQPGRRHR